MVKSDKIVILIEPDLKSFLQSVADNKGITLSEYVRYVLGRGLETIHNRNLAVRELGKQFNVR